MTLKDLYDQFYAMTDAQVQGLAEKLAQAGLIPKPNQDRLTIWKAWEAVINEAGSMSEAAKNTGQGNLVTPWQRLAAYMKTPLDDPRKVPLEAYSTTQKHVNLTDPNQAQVLLKSSLQQALGRNPTAAETQAYMAALHTAENANPTVTTTNFTPNQTGTAFNSSSTSQGGLNPTDYTSNYAQGHNQVEHASYQASTTYMDALMGALRATV
jgi:hypothetical protein